MKALAAALESLPRWARPVFLRLTPAIERTETFKPKRALYSGQGFNPRKCAEPLFMLGDNGYRPLDAELFARVCEGSFRL